MDFDDFTKIFMQSYDLYASKHPSIIHSYALFKLRKDKYYITSYNIEIPNDFTIKCE